MKEEKHFDYSGSLTGNRSAFAGERIDRNRLGNIQPDYVKGNSAVGKKAVKVPDIHADCRIVHDKFGGGKVLKVEKETALIKFDNGPTMKLMLQYAPITKEKDAI